MKNPAGLHTRRVFVGINLDKGIIHMTTVEDKVTPLPGMAERLAQRGRKAMDDYGKSHGHAVKAVIEYGNVLLEGRKMFPSHKLFGHWVSENRLDEGKPWKDFRERSQAMKLAEMVVIETFSITVLDACPRSRPNDIMIWYRRQTGESTGEHGESRRRGRPPKAVVEAAQEALDGAIEALPENDRLTLAELKRRLKDDAAKELAKERKKLDKEYGDRLREGIQKANQAALADAKQQRELNLSLRTTLNKKAVYSRQEFEIIMSCLHPDTGRHVSDERRAQAFNLFFKRRDQLQRVEK